MHPSATFNKKHQGGFTLVEIMMALMILGFILGTAVLQVSSLYKTNRSNVNTLSLNTIAADELERLKVAWSTDAAWLAGTYSPTASGVTFQCSGWSTLSVAPTTFSNSCNTGTYLKRVKLVATAANSKTFTVYMDIAKPNP